MLPGVPGTTSILVHGKVGDFVGLRVGVVGERVGDVVGFCVGFVVGEVDGCAVGLTVGEEVGCAVGLTVGKRVGESVGLVVGESVGDFVGRLVGLLVGLSVGLLVGALVGGLGHPELPPVQGTSVTITVTLSVPLFPDLNHTDAFAPWSSSVGSTLTMIGRLLSQPLPKRSPEPKSCPLFTKTLS
mmetsp:Transcript_26229/g.42484  ORF Transcript_26229/g.42484 Transcript_26229/m.42484 type:complete len:185 (-) Transcript_26229:844-1398(-)